MARPLPQRIGTAVFLVGVGVAALALLDAFVIHIPGWGYGLVIVGAIVESFTDWDAKAKENGPESSNASSSGYQPDFGEDSAES